VYFYLKCLISMRIILLSSLFLFLVACAKKDRNTANNSKDTSPSALSASALQSAYQQYRNQRTDTMPAHQVQEAGKLYPVDQAPRDTAFFVLREQLREAVQQRNIFPVMEALHPEVKVGFGSEHGPEGFIEIWGLQSEEQTAQSNLWTVLGRVLDGGGVFQDGGKTFIAPYVFATWPDAEDAFDRAAITGAGVRVRSQPNLQSRIITSLSYDIVEFVQRTDQELTIDGETHSWMKIKIPDGQEGFVWGKYVASPIGYRAGFERQPDGQWLMTFFLAGD
jgi:hypothetical protein